MSTQGQGDVAQQSLEERVSQFHTCRLPGQAGIHMGTAALIDDLWKEILTQRDAARKSQSHADRLRTLLSSSRGEQGWRTPDALPELKDGARFAVYLAFDTGEVKLADWVAWTETASEYHASTGVYLGQSPQDGDALYMTDDGFDVRKGDDGRWVSHKHHEDGSRTPFYVTAWMDAMKPLPSAPGSVPTSIAGQVPDDETPTQAEIGNVLADMLGRVNAELQAMTEDELRERWFFRYDPKCSLAWNIYSFHDCLKLYGSSCRRWEEMHNGSCCVVERVRDKFLMPKIKEFEQILLQSSPQPTAGGDA